MAGEGAVLVKHYRELAFMGFTEVVMNLNTILKNISFCKQDLLEHKPDVVILVDYPGFNLRIAEFAKRNGMLVFYYISPQIWAWKQSRVEKIKRYVDRMFVILPFEKEFYDKFQYKVDFIGHPLLDAIGEEKHEDITTWQLSNNLKPLPVIALLPGSRRQEIAIMLPVMLNVINEFPGYQFVIAAAPSIPDGFYSQFTHGIDIPVLKNQTHEILSHAYAALVTSGTATLETALFNVPEVVCYKGGNISYVIARSMVKVKYISLVNLIMEREVVKELIQHEFNARNLVAELRKLLNPEARQRMDSDYVELKQRLGGSGASAKTAELMINYATARVF